MSCRYFRSRQACFRRSPARPRPLTSFVPGRARRCRLSRRPNTQSPAAPASTARSERWPCGPAPGASRSPGATAMSWGVHLAFGATGHEQVDGQFGADFPVAGDLQNPLARRCELDTHAHVIVVVGDLGRGAPSGNLPDAKVADLIDILPRDVTLAHRHHDFGLVIELDLLLQVGDDQVGTLRADIVQLTPTGEAISADHANNMTAGREPFAEQDRIIRVGCRDGDVRTADGLLGR